MRATALYRMMHQRKVIDCVEITAPVHEIRTSPALQTLRLAPNRGVSRQIRSLVRFAAAPEPRRTAKSKTAKRTKQQIEAPITRNRRAIMARAPQPNESERDC